MEWTANNLSEAELKKRQEQYIKEAMEMAKRSGLLTDKPEPPVITAPEEEPIVTLPAEITSQIPGYSALEQIRSGEIPTEITSQIPGYSALEQIRSGEIPTEITSQIPGYSALEQVRSGEIPTEITSQIPGASVIEQISGSEFPSNILPQIPSVFPTNIFSVPANSAGSFKVNAEPENEMKKQVEIHINNEKIISQERAESIALGELINTMSKENKQVTDSVGDSFCGELKTESVPVNISNLPSPPNLGMIPAPPPPPEFADKEPEINCDEIITAPNFTEYINQHNRNTDKAENKPVTPPKTTQTPPRQKQNTAKKQHSNRSQTAQNSKHSNSNEQCQNSKKN